MQALSSPSIAVAVTVIGRGRSAIVVRLHGEHDLATAHALRSELQATPQHYGIVVDLGLCTFVDSAILSVLLRAASGRARVAVVLPAEESIVTRAAVAVGLSSLVTCTECVDDALAAVGAVDAAVADER